MSQMSKMSENNKMVKMAKMTKMAKMAKSDKNIPLDSHASWLPYWLIPSLQKHQKIQICKNTRGHHTESKNFL